MAFNKDNLLLAELKSSLNGSNLSGDDGQHLDVDTVELIEAAPEASLSETCEDNSHGSIVQVLTATRNDATACETLGKILDGLSFASTGGSGRRSTESESQRGGQGHDAAISERSDDKASIEALILITEIELTCALFDENVILFFVPVEPKHRLPGEFLLTED